MQADNGSMLTAALRRDRLLVSSALLLVVALCWAYLWTGAGTLQAMGDMLMPMSSGPWTFARTLLMPNCLSFF